MDVRVAESAQPLQVRRLIVTALRPERLVMHVLSGPHFAQVAGFAEVLQTEQV